jgi:hypothetical protein
MKQVPGVCGLAQVPSMQAAGWHASGGMTGCHALPCAAVHSATVLHAKLSLSWQRPSLPHVWLGGHWSSPVHPPDGLPLGPVHADAATAAIAATRKRWNGTPTATETSWTRSARTKGSSGCEPFN